MLGRRVTNRGRCFISVHELSLSSLASIAGCRIAVVHSSKQSMWLIVCLAVIPLDLRNHIFPHGNTNRAKTTQA